MFFRSLEAGIAGPGVFLAEQVLQGSTEKGRDFQLIFERREGINYTKGGRESNSWEVWHKLLEVFS